MRFRRIGNIDVSVVSLSAADVSGMPSAVCKDIVAKALTAGVNFLHSIEPDETSALGDCLSSLEARRRTAVAAGIPRFFAAYAEHPMNAGEFLEHELADRLERLRSKYLDCFILDLGSGTSVDLESVLREEIASASAVRAVRTSSFEGGIFLHETLSECLQVLQRFKSQGRIRLIGLSGENLSAVRRVLVKHESIDVAFVPYNYAFRAAAAELIPVAAEKHTAIITTRPLWWGVREIPVTVLAESPYPADMASISVDADKLMAAAFRWPLNETTVASVLIEASPAELADVAPAAEESIWTRNDEETLRGIAEVASAQRGIFLMLSAMNSADPILRARGWAACLRMGIDDSGYDPAASESTRKAALKKIADSSVQAKPATPEDLDELL